MAILNDTTLRHTLLAFGLEVALPSAWFVAVHTIKRATCRSRGPVMASSPAIFCHMASRRCIARAASRPWVRANAPCVQSGHGEHFCPLFERHNCKWLANSADSTLCDLLNRFRAQMRASPSIRPTSESMRYTCHCYGGSINKPRCENDNPLVQDTFLCPASCLHKRATLRDLIPGFRP